MLGKETSRACALMSVCDVARQRRGIVPPTRSAQPLRGVLDASQPRLREAVYLCTKSATGGVLYSKRATSWRTPRGPAPRPPPRAMFVVKTWLAVTSPLASPLTCSLHLPAARVCPVAPPCQQTPWTGPGGPARGLGGDTQA